jgi:O-acetyl-ADP-ribose deacetylase (regulator of RNase III)
MNRTTDYSINNSVFRVTYGDITQVQADALVSSDDNHLTMGGGVSLAILKAGGEVIQREARKHIPLEIGSVAVTSAGRLPAKYIFHAVTIDYDDWIYASEESIRSATLRSMELADTLSVRRIAFPALGTGVAGFPFQLAAEVMTRTIADYLLGRTKIELVTLTLYARGGINTDDLNVFYERAVALASLSTQTKRLNNLVTELGHIVNGMDVPLLSKRVADLQAALKQTQRALAEQPGTLERLDEIQDRSGVTEISQQVIQTSSEAQESAIWEDKQLESKVLRTKLQGLQSMLNIQISNLNRLMIDKAKYGGIGVPPRLEHAIEDINKQIGETEKQIREVKMQLASLGGGEIG